MICYSLICSENHRFESWFASAEAYNNLKKAGHLSCSVCGSENVEKAVMAPNVSMASKKRAAKEQPLTGSKSPTEKAIKELKRHIEKNIVEMHSGSWPRPFNFVRVRHQGR